MRWQLGNEVFCFQRSCSWMCQHQCHFSNLFMKKKQSAPNQKHSNGAIELAIILCASSTFSMEFCAWKSVEGATAAQIENDRALRYRATVKSFTSWLICVVTSVDRLASERPALSHLVQRMYNTHVLLVCMCTRRIQIIVICGNLHLWSPLITGQSWMHHLKGVSLMQIHISMASKWYGAIEYRAMCVISICIRTGTPSTRVNN